MLGFGQLGLLALGQAPNNATTQYTLTSAAGAAALSGQNIKVFQSRVTSFAAFILTGQASTKKVGFGLSAGALTLSGITTTQKISRLTSVGAFTLSGQVANQNISHVSLGTAFTLIGQNAKQFISHLSQTGTFVLTGVAIFIVRLAAAVGFDRIRQVNFVLQKIRGTPPELEE